ncbi:PAS domain-containing protein [Clostridium sp. Marseille-Q2269]|uniref:PAS domain-containing protein n=1 Tax=Clostridium sp. Marseille-Q2269 TaxID=2942205 RepID=UPI002072F486|nr:PAS domain-containing protein [Clostridium sp. Marseille-Q2269]
MYKMMEQKAFNKYIEKVSEEEFHVYFYLKTELEKIKMGEYLNLDNKKIKKIVTIKLNYLKGNISLEEAKREMKERFDKITPEEFAICEQYLQQYGISDDELAEKMDGILEIFEGILINNKLDIDLGHPIRTYLDEVDAIRRVLNKMRSILQKKFIKNQWAELYDKLKKINIHFARKQNQLFPALEGKGFDKPSKVMWTLDNNIRDIIKKAKGYLEADQDKEFLELQDEVIEMVEDMMVKEEEILYPTSIEILSEEDFVKMRKGDDENEIVKFYSDTKHRVFPRSAGVIERKVENCHPRESVSTVEEIIRAFRAFRAGEKDEAEFWLEIGGKFIYIIYNAVRDEVGNFKGVLEMMQDVTRIRSLERSQRLLSWNGKKENIGND